MTETLEHRPVLLEEAVAALSIKPNGVYVDATFGRGGHSRKILHELGAKGKLIALDRDAAAMEAASVISDKRFRALHERFGRLQDILASERIATVDGVLLDLGMSSTQLDDRERGFSFRHNGPLDMRMDTRCAPSAGEWLNAASEQEIAQVIRDYGEERFAKSIAKRITAARKDAPITTTGALARLIARAVTTFERGQDPATRTFQALRIFINRELEELTLVLPQSLQLLAPGGRLVVISFHSLEDRIVKRFMRTHSSPAHLPARLPLKASELPQPRLKLIGKPIHAAAAEIEANPRARSALLRVAEKLALQ